MDLIAESDLKYFTAAALSGLCANPSFATPESAKYRKMKNLTLEKLAVISALQVMEELNGLKQAMAKDGVEISAEGNGLAK